jgi:hypothetical protein
MQREEDAPVRLAACGQSPPAPPKEHIATQVAVVPVARVRTSLRRRTSSDPTAD